MRVRLLVALGLVAIGVGTRWIFHETSFAPNIEFVTVCALIAGYYLRGPFMIAVPLAIMFFSDTIIGNSSIFLFTWSAFLIGGVIGYLLHRCSKGKNTVAASTLTGLGFSVFFFLFTNFGVWLQGWYPPTFAGLMESYIMGIPFLKYNLVSTLILVPVGFTIAEYVLARSRMLAAKRVTIHK